MRLIFILISLLLAFSANAETSVWKWDADGTLSFTDNEKRIPSKYKDSAINFVVDGLDSYKKYTPIGGSKESSEN